MSCGWGTTSTAGRMLPSHNSWRSSAVRPVSPIKEDIVKKINVGSTPLPPFCHQEKTSAYLYTERRKCERQGLMVARRLQRDVVFLGRLYSLRGGENSSENVVFSPTICSLLFASIRIGRKLAAVRLFELHEICVLFCKLYICSLSHCFISTLDEVKGYFTSSPSSVFTVHIMFQRRVSFIF